MRENTTGYVEYEVYIDDEYYASTDSVKEAIRYADDHEEGETVSIKVRVIQETKMTLSDFLKHYA